jgi:benzylsuccinate CoA-transferase BbsE subunit
MSVPDSGPHAGALEGLVVFELGDEGTQLCGKHLADMGASVVKVEPRSGAPTRHRGPFAGGVADPDASIAFWAHNTNKASITLDLDSAAHRDVLAALLERADVVLEDAAPGTLDAMGLGYEWLSAANPGLVMTSVTPFGQTGPLAGWKGGDLVTWAMGGAMGLIGYAERGTPPLAPQGDLSYQAAGLWATIGTMAALLGRDGLGGLGQHVDVSIQEAVVFFTDGYGLGPLEYTGRTVTRSDAANLVPTADGGYIVAQMLNITTERWTAFRDWLVDHGLGKELTAFEPAEFERHREPLLTAVTEIAATRTRAELFSLGQSFGFTWMAVNGPADLADDLQLAARGFFRELEHPERTERYRYAGPASQWSEAPWQLRRRAPLLGEDNAAFGVEG